MSDEGENQSHTEYEEDLNSIIISFMKKIKFPDPLLVQKEIERTLNMTYEEYKTMDVHRIPDEEKLDTLEAIATHIRFSEDMSKLTKIIRDYDGEKHPLYSLPLFDISDMVKAFVDDLEKIGGLISDFGSKEVSQVRLYKRMKTFPAVFDGLSSERLPSTYITLFEAVVTQYLEPMARKLNPNLKKQKYVSPASAMKTINQKTNFKHSKLLNMVDCPLRNAIQHELFIDQRKDHRFIYSDQKGEEISLTYEEMRRKVVYLIEFVSCLEVLIDSKNLVLTVEKVLHLILKNNAMKYSQTTERIFLRGEKIATLLRLDKLVYCYGLQLAGQYCWEKRYPEAVKKYTQGLAITTKFRNEQWYIEDAYGLITFIARERKNIRLDNRLLGLLSAHLEKLGDLTNHEKKYLAKTYLNAGVTYQIIRKFHKAKRQLQKVKQYEKYLTHEEKTKLAYTFAVLSKKM